MVETSSWNRNPFWNEILAALFRLVAVEAFTALLIQSQYKKKVKKNKVVWSGLILEYPPRWT